MTEQVERLLVARVADDVGGRAGGLLVEPRAQLVLLLERGQRGGRRLVLGREEARAVREDLLLGRLVDGRRDVALRLSFV